MIVWPSNWIILRQVVLRSAIYAAAMEVGALILTYVGVIRSVPGSIFVLFWSLQASTGYALRRDRIDGALGAAVIGLLLASMSGMVAWLLLVVTRTAPTSLALGAFAFTLVLTWGTAIVRRRTDPHGP